MDANVQVYAKSWVFEGTGEEVYRQPDDSCSVSICSSSPTHVNMLNNKSDTHKNDHSRKLSDANSERFAHPLSSFSRCATPSPIPHSGKATPTNIIYAEYSNHDHRMQKSNRLTVDYVQSIDLAIAPDATVFTPKISVASTSIPLKNTIKNNIQSSNGPSSISSQQDDSQYASMLAELEQSLIEKKNQTTDKSPDDTSLSTDKFGSSKSSSKDLEFSKELELALQLIQDLETPSEPDGQGSHSAAVAKLARSESEKTLSAAVSLPSPEQGPYKLQTPEAQTPQNGKHNDYRRTDAIQIEASSQSTSGYSSPNSYSSNMRISSNASAIHNGVYTDDQSNVIRIYIGENTPNITPMTKHKIKSNSKQPVKGCALSKQLQSTDSCRFKKRSQLNLQSDFHDRIFKSECLAYLTDEELVARHKCNRDVIRVRLITIIQTPCI